VEEPRRSVLASVALLLVREPSEKAVCGLLSRNVVGLGVYKLSNSCTKALQEDLAFFCPMLEAAGRTSPSSE
jgi:hypothetical protein